jgi:uncharacterized protein
VTGKHEVMSWDLFAAGSRELAAMIRADEFHPDLIVGVARGGLFVMGALGYALDIKNLYLMNVAFYTGVDERLSMPVMLPPTPQAIDFAGASVLITDDVADTGATLELVHDFLVAHVEEVRSAVLYEKPGSTVKCEYVWRRTDLWIDFPWTEDV